MRKFDIEAAKRHEPIQIGSDREGWRDISFVGWTPCGDIVLCELTGSGRETLVVFTGDPAGRLRMKPQKHTVFVNAMAGGTAAWFSRKEAAEDAQHTRDVIARAVPVEIEE